MDEQLVAPTADTAGTAVSVHDELAASFKAELEAERNPPKAEKAEKPAPAAPEIVETEEQAPLEAAPVETEESEAEEADDTAHDDADSEAETPTVDSQAIAPSGMTEADKAIYAKLPTELKAWVAKQESARTADYTRKTQEVAEKRKQFESGVQGIQTRLQALDQQLAQFTDNRNLAPPNPALRETDPFAYDEQLAHYMQARHVAELATKEREKLQAEHADVSKHMERQFQQEKEQQLRELAPELFGDKGNEIGRQIQQYAVKTGYTVEQLKTASATDILTLWKAQRFDAIEAAKKNVKSVPPPAMKASKPGPAKAVGRPNAVSQALKAFDSAPSRSNLAAAYLAEIRSEKR